MKRRAGAELAQLAPSADENVARIISKAAPTGSKRRALGDIGNVTAQPSGAARGDKAAPAARKQQAPTTAGAQQAVVQGGAAGPLPEPVLQQLADAPVRITRAKMRALASGASAAEVVKPTRRSSSGPGGGAGGGRRASAATAAMAATPMPEQVAQPQPAGPLRSPLPDIDKADHANHLAETLYVNDIYAYFRRVEGRFRVPHDYMTQQPDINEKMRAILIDWLVEVHLKFKLMPESLFLTINLIDRYLAARQVTRKNLQLVGVTAMLVAAKYEEIWAPEVRDFVYISDKAYSRKQILDTEKDMLSALGYNLSLPTSYQFLARLLKAAGVHYEKHLALFVAYCAELCLVDHGMLRHSYSELAAGIMYVAMRAFGKADPYPRALMRHASHSQEAVLHVSKDVVRLVAAAHGSSLQAVVKKYSSAKFCEAALVKPPLAILDE